MNTAPAHWIAEENINCKIDGTMNIKEYTYSTSWAAINSNPPSIVNIESISRCNRKCKYCPNSRIERKDHIMPKESFFNVIDQLSDWGFTGLLGNAVLSEPLMDNRIIELYAYSREKLPGAKLHVETNGDLLTPHIASELFRAGVTTIRITQHDPKFKKEKEFEAWLDLHPEFYNRFTILRPGWRPLNWGGIIDGDYYPWRHQCPYYSNLIVDCYGNVLLCCNDLYAENSFGSIYDNSLKEIWDSSEPMRKILFYGGHNKVLDICLRCVGPDDNPIRRLLLRSKNIARGLLANLRELK